MKHHTYATLICRKEASSVREPVLQFWTFRTDSHVESRDQGFCFKTKTETMIFVLEVPREQYFVLEDNITALFSY